MLIKDFGVSIITLFNDTFAVVCIIIVKSSVIKLFDCKSKLLNVKFHDKLLLGGGGLGYFMVIRTICTYL